MKTKRLSDALLAVCALYELGGSHKKVRTIDVAIHLFRQYPSRFCIDGYPEYPEREKAREEKLKARQEAQNEENPSFDGDKNNEDEKED